MLLIMSTAAYSSNEPVCTQDSKWKFVVNNAYRVADDYAMEYLPSSTFISANEHYNFVKQMDGEYKGQYLLLIINEHGQNTSFAALLPLFDVDQPSQNLDDNFPLWKVVLAKFNGHEY